MSHEIYERDNLFYVDSDESYEAEGRRKPWHGLGTPVLHAPTSAEALTLAGLDWEVLKTPVFTESGIKCGSAQATIRSDTKEYLGMVTDRYKIVQNKDAFAFTDGLLGKDCRYETAGSLRNGRTVWLLAQMPKMKVCGDDVANYLCFTNSHDGTGAVRVVLTPTRVVCNNTLNLALRSAERRWATRHCGNIEAKMEEAKKTLELAFEYQEALKVEAEEMANITVNEEETEKLLRMLFPIKDDDTDRAKRNMENAKNDFIVCLNMPDIQKFYGTKWALVNAAADFVDHRTPARLTKSYAENNFGRILDGSTLLDTVMSSVGNDGKIILP